MAKEQVEPSYTSHAARVFVIPQMILDLIVIGPRVRPFLGAAPARPPATVVAGNGRAVTACRPP